MTADPPAAVRVRSVGARARAALHPGRRGTVAAVFRHSFYLRLGDDWVCVGERRIGRGPLNLVCETPLRGGRLRDVVPAVVGDCRLLLAGVVDIDWSQALPWRVTATPRWSAGSLRRGLVTLERLFSVTPTRAQGLGGFAETGFRPSTPVERHAAGAVGRLVEWLRCGTETGHAQAPDGVCGLLGLGPGLTPSGDDLLGGVMATLQRVGMSRSAGVLWRFIEPRLSTATHAISAAHLRAAADGECGEDLDVLLDALLRGDAEAVRIAWAPLAASEHCSARDALAGAVLALRALLAAQGNAERIEPVQATGG